jgi:hypothetical protein
VNQASTRVLFVLTGLLFTFVLISSPSTVHGEEISLTSIAFEETSILELTNNSNKEVKTLRVWLGSDFSFDSFKTELGWVGEKTPNGVVIFTSSEGIKPGDSVKFGVKTDKETSKINWKALDNTNTQIDTGVSIATDIPKVVTSSIIDNTPTNLGDGIFTESTFRIVPEKPNVGSTIRVTGNSFGSSQEFDFYIDSKKLGSFVTDKNGYFMTTMKIPDTQKADRVTLKVVDKEDEEKTLSIRIGDVKNRIPITENIPLKINGLPDIINRGDFLEISGTGNPNGAIIAEITNPDGNTLNSRTAEIDTKGNWKLDEPIIIPLDAVFGKYSAIISDGRDTELISWTIESNKVILIAPTKIMFNGGELITFNGTALPNRSLDLVLEDSLGNQIMSDLLEIGNSGIVEFEYQTTKNVDKEGTWILIATQEQHKELIYVGYDEIPSIPVHMEFHKLNYKSSEIAHLTLTGKPSDKLSLIVVSLSGNVKKEDISIELGADGRGTYDLELTGFDSGIYNAVIKKGSTQSHARFTVGLQLGSGAIEATTTKSVYLPGESILIIGQTNPDSLLTGTLFDPNKKEVKVYEFPSDDKGKFTENRLRIPSNAIAGPWMIKIDSGQNFYNLDLEVSTVLIDGMVVNIEKDRELPGFGTIIKIQVDGASPKSSVSIVITDQYGNIIDESVQCNATAASNCEVPWTITSNLLPGTYSVNATDYINSAGTTFVVD